MSGVSQQQLQEGYKQSDVGLIPIDWEVKPLGELVSHVEYGSSAKSSESGAIPVLRMGNLQSGKIDWDGLVYTSDPVEIAKYKLCKDDVLFNRTNTVDLVGKTSIYKGEYQAVFAGYLIRIHRIESLLDADFLNYTLNSYHSKKYSKYILSVAVSQANINGQKLKTYPVPIPPSKKEQTAIASALSDVDALITSLKKLIAKKRAIKTAAMQQLLTGKKRLPPFDTLASKAGKPAYKQTELGEIPVDWRVAPINSLCQIMTGNTPSTSRLEYYGEEYLFVSPADMQGQKYILTAGKTLSKAGFFTCRQYPKASILFTCIGSTIGKCCIAGETLTSNQQINAVLPSEKVDMDYLYYQLFYTAPVVKQQAGEQAVPIVNKTQFGEHLVLVPNDQSEQNEISKLLSDMDREINVLEQRLTKTQQIKQGMMQELLTGRTRLV